MIETVAKLEDRLAHIITPVSLSIIGCVVNGPGEARETDLGLTGGGNGVHKMYVGGKPDHNIGSDQMIEHIVRLVEEKAAAIEAQKALSARLAAAE